MSEPSEVNDARRLELISAAQRQCVDALTDLGGRNTLLYYKDRRAGTLDLASADPDVLERFEKTGRARLTKLFTDADERADAIRRMQTIYRKSRELTEERGIRAAYLATGLARWDELFLDPAAPVLLRGLTITPTRARYDDPAPPPPSADPPRSAEPPRTGESSSSAAPPATAEPAPAGEPPLTDDPPRPINRPTPAPLVTGATRVPIALPARTVTPVEGPPPSRALPPIPRS